ncbi:ABC transporter permease [Flavobacterium humi]|uniref:ABC transporter permease n=1 Tax=Flavobacterium humi TaxID=2562683 RepID=A0A4Z0L5D8_9FLAO|nr:FtsX-like permease family protein [Flavobacterium humi]TGD57602.1 ABC transporter permease [Flavobacterium humi]
MNFSLYIAKRYLRSSSKNNAINIITGIASFGIIVGAMALFVVLSVFSGLKDFSLSFSNDFDPDIKIVPRYGKSFYVLDEHRERLKKAKDIAFYSSVIEEKVLFVYKSKEQVALIKGVDNQYNLVNHVQRTIYQGQWLSPETPQVVVGNGIMQKLSMGLFDLSNTFEIYVPKPGKGAINNPESAFNKSSLIPIGIYAISEELDSKYVFADLKLTQQLLEFRPDQITGIEIKLAAGANENRALQNLNAIFGSNYIIKNRAQLNDSLHKMLNTENTAIYLIFTLVIILTLFTLAGAIIMMILDKKDNLKTLFNIGTPIKDIQKIFLLQGSLLTLFGGLIGLFLGTIIVLIQQYFKVIMITESLPYPVIFNLQNIVVVFLTIVILGFIASLIASSRVSKKLLD